MIPKKRLVPLLKNFDPIEEQVQGKKRLLSLNSQPHFKPMNASTFDIPEERKVIHRQVINIPRKASFDIELSW